MEREYASKEELYFSWYLDELKEAGYIQQYEFEPELFVLSHKVVHDWIKPLKTKDKDMETTLLREHVYTPDFEVMWEEKAHNVFFTKSTDNTNFKNHPFYVDNVNSDYPYMYIEIKPIFDQNNMTRLFSINQKWMYEEHGEYINLIKVPDIFKKTFTPKRYLTTDISGKPRKINWEIKTLDGYVAESG
jgi:hypothetical protein